MTATKTLKIIESGYTYIVKEKVFSSDIKPYYFGTVTMVGAGNTRISYRAHQDDKEGRIVDLIVQEKYRGRGFARKLVEIAETRFSHHGVIKVNGHAEPEVHDFWRKLGYQILPNNDILKHLT